MALARSNRKKMEKAPVIYSMLCDIEVMADGYTPTTQNYDAVSGIMFPDYSASPLNLFPRCVLIDPNSPVASKTCNVTASKWQMNLVFALRHLLRPFVVFRRVAGISSPYNIG